MEPCLLEDKVGLPRIDAYEKCGFMDAFGLPSFKRVAGTLNWYKNGARRQPVQKAPGVEIQVLFDQAGGAAKGAGAWAQQRAVPRSDGFDSPGGHRPDVVSWHFRANSTPSGSSELEVSVDWPKPITCRGFLSTRRSSASCRGYATRQGRRKGACWRAVSVR